MERYNYELISSGGLRPPQHQVEYKSSLLIIEFVSLIAAEAGDLRYYINLLHYNNKLLLSLHCQNDPFLMLDLNVVC